MPAPYPLVEMPPGDYNDPFDSQAIIMAAGHNTFIQGINAMAYHAPKVSGKKIQPFLLFSLTVVDNIHHHHHLEEELYFPEMEKRLGEGALSGNVEQHHQFVPQLEELQKYLEDAKAGKARINSFGDIMVNHLNQEIPTLESSRLREKFTEKDLKDIKNLADKKALATIDFSTTLPLALRPNSNTWADNMNRGPSPIFDVPEFPTLRRVKPLPKRRRTTAEATPPDGDHPPSQSTLGLPFPLPGPDATAEELIAHAESLSAHMALQSYYMPGLQEIFNRTPEMMNRGDASYGGGGGSGDGDDGEDGDDDGMEHLQQPGNTKKRKVPTNASGSPGHGGHDAGDAQSGGEDEPTERGIPTGRPDDTIDVFQPPSTSPFNGLGIRRGKPPRITLAGLQHKETLKSRKRQLAAVLGALSLGDTLALDQALSANYPFIGGPGFGENVDPPRVRISRRFGPRLARAARFSEKYRHPDKSAFTESEFTYSCPSSTADRLVATKEEVTMLRGRFEAELARQAAKAAKLAATNKLMSALPATKSNRQKRSGRSSQTRSRTTANNTNVTNNTTTTTATTTTTPSASPAKGDLAATENSDPAALMGIKQPRGGKKKKRSALANASNPHHLRNYVPSRLPHSGQPNSGSGNGGGGGGGAQANANAQNYLGPLPLRFLSADIPPRRRRGRGGDKVPAVPAAGEGPVLTNPAEEWICAFCEHDLFYGDDAQHRRAVRSRKKILRRRRRARERAAAAASGTSTAKGPPEKQPQEEYEMHPGYAPGVEDVANANLPKQTKWRGDPGKEDMTSQAGEGG
ncbi:hypothetical protein FB45DRAFT_1061644 [Roridomyces roridus]|uniref:Hemerythrin-like domain-containing protein n=1 Tax=Roridomyces roridus TaxID=1738132 RepID=A0AAD7BL67_9AGAR|nr:hypothetical protein FB45DRAFT_1061644 [Roridomyces roridus]